MTRSFVLLRAGVLVPLTAAFLCFAGPAVAQGVDTYSGDIPAAVNGNLPAKGQANLDPSTDRSLRPQPGAKAALVQAGGGYDTVSSDGSGSTAEAPLPGQLQNAGFEYGYLERALALFEEQRSLIQSFSDTAEEKFKASLGTQVDVLTAQLELMKLTARQAEYEKRFHLVSSRIDRLLSQTSGAATVSIPADEEPRELSYTLEEIYRMARYSPVPKKPGEAAEQLATNGHGEKDSASSPLSLQLAETYLEATTSWRLIQLYKTNIIPLAGVALESAFGSYQAGKTDFTQLMGTALTLFDAQLDNCRNTADYQAAVAHLEFLAGVKLTQPKEVASASR